MEGAAGAWCGQVMLASDHLVVLTEDGDLASGEGDPGPARRDRAISGDRGQDLEPSGCGGRTAIVRPEHSGNGCIRHPPEAVMKTSLHWRWGAALILLLGARSRSRQRSVRRGTSARLQAYGEQIWDYYRGQRALGDIDVGLGYTRIYGGLVEFLSSRGAAS